jgi:enoyl-CoA hydratase/carnithine racemase
LAERYGWINRSLPSAEVESFVSDLARRIAAFPRRAVELSKLAVDAARDEPLREALLTELWAFNQSLVTAHTRQRFTQYMAQYGQRRSHELVLADVLAELNGLT